MGTARDDGSQQALTGPARRRHRTPEWRHPHDPDAATKGTTPTRRWRTCVRNRWDEAFLGALHADFVVDDLSSAR